MKVEPLKGKIWKEWWTPEIEEKNKKYHAKVEDIKSAVEWLKLEDVKTIRKYNFKEISWGDMNRELDENREKAFEDVTKR